MDCSVVIPTYNRAGILEKTLQALAGQHFSRSREFEVLVVDDGSTDDTAARVRNLQATFPVSLTYLHQKNQLQGAARNRGVRAARGRYLIFLGDDTVPRSNFLEEHLKSHQGDEPSRVVIGYTPWAPELEATRFMHYVGEQGWQFGFSLIEDPEDVPFNFFYTSNISMRRNFFQRSGGFDEEFREYGWEDVEMGLRLKKMGMRLVYNRKAVAYHYHPTTLASFVRRQQKVGYSAWTLYRKHPELAEFLGISHLPHYSPADRLKLKALTWLCRLTERSAWPDLSRFYPDLMTYHYARGVEKARK